MEKQTEATRRGLQGKDAAAYLGVSVSMVDLLARRGELSPRYIGRARVFLIEDLDRFLESAPSARPAPKPSPAVDALGTAGVR